MVGICQDQTILAYAENDMANTHATFIQVAIHQLLQESSLTLQNMDAIVVTMGPGSYTGLRVGLSSAKGIAYALNKPLIGLSTLALLANAARRTEAFNIQKDHLQIFSMIDARRMEVFGAIFDKNQQYILPEQSIILDENFMNTMTQKGAVLCIGSGVPKTQLAFNHPNLFFSDITYDIHDCLSLANEKYKIQAFEDLAYCSPSYLKDFYQNPTTR